ncbi:damage-control phosphatase ARMT1 family protein [Nocardia terpenica]|uniref:DUF89 family protein n=1 Tax=Nocardia terpenica TaxID=455432 RepID=A0A6G9Z5F2_9NOCA|nr:damage-control phosphatase ARMT1 family protein [Nocardia terpenica]QIS20670.1 DUF89 family protein [Nocardia terpenica]
MTDVPPILAGVPGTFPHSVFHERHPRLIEQVIGAHPYGPAARVALRELLAESTNGTVRPPEPGGERVAPWLEWGREMWSRPWGEVPFLWAESYFYRRLLDAVGYFGEGPWRRIDPFGPTKAAELYGRAVDDELAALDGLVDRPVDSVRDALLRSALWGNQADLGFRLTAESGAVDTRLLVDDSAALWAALERTPGATVALIADNAGRELLPDLVLADHLLTVGPVDRVVVHVKPHPYFVSDATMTDLLAALRRLRDAETPQAREVGQRLWQAMADDRLVVRAHEFFCAPLSFHDMPADLAGELTGAAMTILKGDLNYRRLVGDRYWPPTTSFAELVRYFPTPVTALRTLKSDVVVGISAEQVNALDAAGENWRSSGKHALIQSNTAA